MAETFIVSIGSPCNQRGSYRAHRCDDGSAVIVRNLAEIGDAGFRPSHILPSGYPYLALWAGEMLEDTKIAYVLDDPELGWFVTEESNELSKAIARAPEKTGYRCGSCGYGTNNAALQLERCPSCGRWGTIFPS